MIAFDRYALAACATGQMSFQGAMTHKNVVVDVAMTAHAEKRRPLLGVIYDEVARSAQTRIPTVIDVILSRQESLGGPSR